MIPLTGGPQRSQIHRDGSRKVGAGGWAGEGEFVFNGKYGFMGPGFQFHKLKRAVQVDGGDGYATA